VSADTIAEITKAFEALAARRAQNRIDKRNQRSRQADRQADIVHIRESKKDIEPKGSISRKTLSVGRARARRTLPADWNPGVAEADAAEVAKFRDYCQAHGKQYVDWDAAWRNWLASPYRKPNGGNGNGLRETATPFSDELLERNLRARDQLRRFAAGEH